MVILLISLRLCVAFKVFTAEYQDGCLHVYVPATLFFVNKVDRKSLVIFVV